MLGFMRLEPLNCLDRVSFVPMHGWLGLPCLWVVAGNVGSPCGDTWSLSDRRAIASAQVFERFRSTPPLAAHPFQRLDAKTPWIRTILFERSLGQDGNTAQSQREIVQRWPGGSAPDRGPVRIVMLDATGPVSCPPRRVPAGPGV